MSFIRRGARNGLWRWREALAGAAAMLFGLWAVIGSGGIVEILGYSFAVAGAVLAFAGLQRARFRVGSDGPGVVEVTEAQVTYFGPREGGTVAVGSLLRVELDPSGRAGPSWVLTEDGLPPVAIPTTAENAEALFDVFASLPGIQTERMLAELKRRPKGRVVIWQAAAASQRPRLTPVH